jgi:hypothetical protein
MTRSRPAGGQLNSSAQRSHAAGVTTSGVTPQRQMDQSRWERVIGLPPPDRAELRATDGRRAPVKFIVWLDPWPASSIAAEIVDSQHRLTQTHQREQWSAIDDQRRTPR